MLQKRLLLCCVIIVLVLFVSSCAKKEVEAKVDFKDSCNKLSENTVSSCSKNANWQVLQDGASYLGTYDCKPLSQESETFRSETPALDEASPSKDVTLVADQEVFDKISCSDDPSQALEDAIEQNQVKVESKVFVK